MNAEIGTLTLSDIFDLLSSQTLRYNQILVEGGSKDEFQLLRDSIILLQQELLRRKDSGEDENSD